MDELYPLLLKPEFQRRVWGAHDLRPVYDLEPAEAIGEAWITGEQCEVQNGQHAGKTLAEVWRVLGAELTGHAAPAGRFPLLIKFLFPREKLSVQVHPDDEMARRLSQPCGKTECWYVLQAERGAQVGVGLKPGTTKQDFAQAVQAGGAEQLLNWIDIRAGDLIYVEAGTVHAIGPGSILVETQQNSDTTFRLYDYGRPRELHVERGLAAMKEETGSGRLWPKAMRRNLTLLAATPFFCLRHHVIDGEAEAWREASGAERSALTILVGLRGRSRVTAGSSVTLDAGHAVIIPPGIQEYRVEAEPEGEFLAVTPGKIG